MNTSFNLKDPITLSEDEKFFLTIARMAADLSPDRSRQVGAVLVSQELNIIGTGTNTLPYGVPHEDKYLVRPAKYNWTEHAERNVVYEAARKGQSTEGAMMVLPWFPCMPCARCIVQSGVRRVIAQNPDCSDPTWGSDFIDALELFKAAGVQFDAYFDNSPIAKAVADGAGARVIASDARARLDEAVANWNENRLVDRLARRPRA